MAKPVVTQKPSLKPFSVRFDQAERDALNKARRKQDTPAASIVRQATREWLKANGYLK
jgi:hypothetical protein